MPRARLDELDQRFAEAQKTYSRYSVRFNHIHQMLTVVTMLFTLASTFIPIVSESLGVTKDSTDEKILRVTSIFTGALATSVMGFMHGAKFYVISTKCESLALLINVYLSGMITDSSERERMRDQIITEMRTTHLTWVEVPSLVHIDETRPPMALAFADYPPPILCVDGLHKHSSDVI